MTNGSGIEALIGGSGNNSFIFATAHLLPGTINGGTAAQTRSTIRLTHTAVTVNFTAGTATGTTGFSNIGNVVAAGSATTMSSGIPLPRTTAGAA